MSNRLQRAAQQLGICCSGLYDPDDQPKSRFIMVAIISLGLTPTAPLWVALVIVSRIFALSIMAHLTYAQMFSKPVMARPCGRARSGIQKNLDGFLPLPV